MAAAGVIGLITQGAGNILSAYGQMRAAQQREDAERRNAAILQEQADLEALATQEELMIHDRQSDQFLGQQVTSFTAAGVDIGSGSVLDVLADTITTAKREAGFIQVQGEFRERFARLRAEEATTRAKDIRGGAKLAAAGTLLGGATNIGTSAEVTGLGR